MKRILFIFFMTSFFISCTNGQLIHTITADDGKTNFLKNYNAVTGLDNTIELKIPNDWSELVRNDSVLYVHKHTEGDVAYQGITITRSNYLPSSSFNEKLINHPRFNNVIGKGPYMTLESGTIKTKKFSNLDYHLIMDTKYDDNDINNMIGLYLLPKQVSSRGQVVISTHGFGNNEIEDQALMFSIISSITERPNEYKEVNRYSEINNISNSIILLDSLLASFKLLSTGDSIDCSMLSETSISSTDKLKFKVRTVSNTNKITLYGKPYARITLPNSNLGLITISVNSRGIRLILTIYDSDFNVVTRFILSSMLRSDCKYSIIRSIYAEENVFFTDEEHVLKDVDTKSYIKKIIKSKTILDESGKAVKHILSESFKNYKC